MTWRNWPQFWRPWVFNWILCRLIGFLFENITCNKSHALKLLMLSSRMLLIITGVTHCHYLGYNHPDMTVGVPSYLQTKGSMNKYKVKKIWNRVDCQRSEKRSKTRKRLKERFINWMKQDTPCKSLRKSSLSSYVQHKNRKNKQLIRLISCRLDAGRLAEGREPLYLNTGSFYSSSFMTDWIN